MFEINTYGKITLTRGDTAYMRVDIEDLDGKGYVPNYGDTLTLYVYNDEETVLSLSASLNSSSWFFTFTKSDTEEIVPWVYSYDVVLETQDEDRFTVASGFFDLIGQDPAEEEPEPEPTPEPEPEDEPDEP